MPVIRWEIRWVLSTHWALICLSDFCTGGAAVRTKKRRKKCTAQKEKNCVRNALVNASTRTFMDIFAAILTALDIADIRIFVVKYYWKQKALQISDDVRTFAKFRINAEAFFWVWAFLRLRFYQRDWKISRLSFRLVSSGGVQLYS